MTDPASPAQRVRSRRSLISFPDRAPAMRSRDRRYSRPPSKGITTPSVAVIALNRLGFGIRPGDISAFNALGNNDVDRLTAYVDQQLDPGSIPDPNVATRFAAAGFTTLGKSRQQLWADHIVNNTQGYSYRILPFEESLRAAFIRAVYSERQLVEVLADFWHNHFNVFGDDSVVAPMFVHYDRDVIRGNMLGNFRQMLTDVAQSTAMLYYLDNYTSSNAGPNENFSREHFELHGLGAENYMGVVQQNQVPTDGDGKPIAYVDADVYEATRAFTGWSVSNSSSDPDVGNTGEFYYRADWHDRFQKTVLGIFMPADQVALKDGLDTINAIATNPGTGRYVARKLCQRLLSDSPPQSLIDQAAAVFNANVDASDQLKQVVRTIVLAPEFRTTWGEKVKRPFEIIASAMRACGADFTPKIDDGDTNSFLFYFRQTGQELYHWPAPNGYPDARGAWTSTTPRVQAWRLVNWMTTFDNDADVRYMDVVAQTPSAFRTANELADHWIPRILGRQMSTVDRQAVVEFMAHGFNPDLDLPIDSDNSTQDRLRSMVALILMSPDFLYR